MVVSDIRVLMGHLHPLLLEGCPGGLYLSSFLQEHPQLGKNRGHYRDCLQVTLGRWRACGQGTGPWHHPNPLSLLSSPLCPVLDSSMWALSIPPTPKLCNQESQGHKLQPILHPSQGSKWESPLAARPAWALLLAEVPGLAMG